MTYALHTFMYIMYFYVDYVTDSISVTSHWRWINMNEWKDAVANSKRNYFVPAVSHVGHAGVKTWGRRTVWQARHNSPPDSRWPSTSENTNFFKTPIWLLVEFIAWKVFGSVMGVICILCCNVSELWPNVYVSLYHMNCTKSI